MEVVPVPDCPPELLLLLLPELRRQKPEEPELPVLLLIPEDEFSLPPPEEELLPDVPVPEEEVPAELNLRQNPLDPEDVLLPVPEFTEEEL